jgi:hypothetical protein
MKFKIVRGISSEALAKHVRREFVDRLPPRSKDDRFSLVLFRFQRDEKGSGVILSSVAEQALAKLGDPHGERTLALGGEFTQEARALLEAQGVEPIALGDWHWTDKSYKRIKNRS